MTPGGGTRLLVLLFLFLSVIDSSVPCYIYAIDDGDCPSNLNLSTCDSVQPGELCEGNGECGSDPNLNNCGGYDVYLRTDTVLDEYASAVFSDTCHNLYPVGVESCPSNNNSAALATCDSVGFGELCEGDGECRTQTSMDNCGSAGFDVYFKTTVLLQRWLRCPCQDDDADGVCNTDELLCELELPLQQTYSCKSPHQNDRNTVDWVRLPASSSCF